MNLEQLTELHEALTKAITLGATAIPPTYFTGVNHARAWAEKQIALKHKSAEAMNSPLLNNIRKSVAKKGAK